ncbi:Uncharacterized alpha/beta hydrolase domain [Massilia sp. PDC64]|nr:DUF2235 domain-containing protein [Massilia sp. PDC64]SDC89529.1 Uncharacterized alpha/beta hydrolase domain [Massilia sp. PDC64]
MTKNQKSDQVGDSRSPALRATERGLRDGVDQAQHIVAERSGQVPKPSPSVNVVPAIKAAYAQKGVPTICRQILWLSFFFDGTGNNRTADEGILKHSNVARLYRAHKRNSPAEGIYSIYIPGVGTYFPEIGDDGGSALGLGCGAMGEERLNFALDQFDACLEAPLARANAPGNAIQEINVAVFGFSRGAALSRAFVNLIMERRCVLRGDKWALRSGSWRVRFRFLGLFDTVASVGLPMSANTTGLREAYGGDITGMIAKRLKNYKATRPTALAFTATANAGADPAPGVENGHRGWGSRLMVHETVEEVRHFVAAHEIRNSFPLDSVSVVLNGQISKPSHFYESLYPGAHSDVGGGYAPGEGAKGIFPSEKLSLIPLRHMYDFALRQGVPMLAEWAPLNKEDFDTDLQMCETYDHYLKAVGNFLSLGDGINRHMALYYAWRFRAIRRKAAGDVAETKLIHVQEDRFRRSGGAAAKEVENLAMREAVAKVSLNALLEAQDVQANAEVDANAPRSGAIKESDIDAARQKYENMHVERLRAKARKDSIPDMTNFQANLDLYDRQLLADVKAIRILLSGSGDGRKETELRPHYKVLLTAYENEFEKNSGLKDEMVIRFFDSYVHNSLAGFGKDATLPSDPRVVYLGGDEKYRYAQVENNAVLANEEKRLA